MTSERKQSILTVGRYFVLAVLAIWITGVGVALGTIICQVVVRRDWSSLQFLLNIANSGLAIFLAHCLRKSRLEVKQETTWRKRSELEVERLNALNARLKDEMRASSARAGELAVELVHVRALVSIHEKNVRGQA